MKRALFALLAVTAVAASSGCCCMERWNPWGCRSGCGSSCDSCGGGDSCGCGDGGGLAGGDSCGCGAHGGLADHGHAHHPVHSRNDGGEAVYAQGPPSASVAYPYYTNRGPRDFLARNPRSIGP